MDKRTLPRHVDGRIKIGAMPIKNFFFYLPILVIGIYLMLSHFTPIVMFLGIITLGLIALLFCEFNNKETGLDIVNDTIKYLIEGNIYFERSCKNVSNSKRCIRNKIKE